MSITLHHPTTAATYAAQSLSANTRRAYRSAWQAWVRWCGAVDPLTGTPEAVAAYLAERASAGQSVSSIRTARAAIREAYKLAGAHLDWDDPALVRTIAGIGRAVGAAPRHQARPATPDVLRAMLAVTDSKRDRALMLVGFAGALRRSEIAALAMADLEWDARGLVLHVRRSKTDQEGRGAMRAIPHGPPGCCPVTAVREWLTVRGEAPGSLFGIGPQWICLLVQAAARRAGLGDGFSGHSLRAGFATACAQAAVPLADMMAVTGHKSVETALGYVRRETVWDNSALRKVWG